MRDLTARSVAAADLISSSADLSFISLRAGAARRWWACAATTPTSCSWSSRSSRWAGSGSGRGGVVRDPALRAERSTGVAAAARELGLRRRAASSPARCPGRAATSSTSCGCGAGAPTARRRRTSPWRSRRAPRDRPPRDGRDPAASSCVAHAGRPAAVAAAERTSWPRSCAAGIDRCCCRRRPRTLGRGGPTSSPAPTSRPADERSSSSSCSAATARSCAAAELARGHDVPLLGVNLGHVGFLAEAERDDLAETVARASSTATSTVEERMTLEVRVCARTAPVVDRALGAQRGERREGRPGSGCSRSSSRSTGVRCHRVRLRRRRARDPDRIDGLRVLRRWPGRLARGRGAAHRSRSPRTPCSRGRWSWRRPPSSPSSCSPSRATASCGATDGAGSTLPAGLAGRGAPLGPCRCGWRGCRRRPFTDRLVAKFDLPVHGWRGRGRRVTNGPGTTGSRGRRVHAPGRRARYRRGASGVAGGASSAVACCWRCACAASG